jgi:HAD superfamily hydrolase (TIGR01450 family)
MEYDAVLVDLDGTVWRGDDPVAGARAGLETLAASGLPLVFVTNNTSVRRQEFRERMADVGLPTDLGPIVTAGWATAQFLADYHPDDTVFVMGGEALRQDIVDAGLTVVTDGTADVVVAAHDEDVTYDRLTKTLRAFRHDTTLVAPNRDRVYPSEDGPVPGAGASVGAVEGMTGQDALVVGKPETRLADIATDAVDATTSDCLIVGDNIDTDILMGERAGMTSALVLTGVSSRSAAEAAPVQPDHVIDSLAEVGSLL